jgi:hypothetical protein
MMERVVTCCKATDGVILFIFTASNNKVNFGIKCLFKLSIGWVKCLVMAWWL